MKENTFGKHVLTLMAGAGAAQVITFLLAPIVTRLYSPSDFTTLEHYAMIIGIISVFSTFKMELAIVQADSESKALALVKWCFRVSLVASVVCAAIVVFFNSSITALFQNDELGIFLYLIPVNLVLFAVFQLLVYWHHRNSKFKASSIAKVSFNASNEVTRISLGLAGVTPGGLILGNVIGRLVSVLAFMRSVGSNFRIKDISSQTVKATANEFSEFYKFTAWGSFLGKLATWAHIFLFTYFFGLWSIGFFALTRRLVQGPLNIFSQSFAQVFYQRISALSDTTLIRQLFFKFFFRLLGLAALMIAVVMLIPNTFYAWVLGEDWLELGDFMRLLIIWFGLNFITSCLAFVNFRLKKQKQMFVLDLLHFIIVISSILLGFYGGFSEWDTLKIFVVGKVVFFLINICAMVYFVLSSAKLKMNE